MEPSRLKAVRTDVRRGRLPCRCLHRDLRPRTDENAEAGSRRGLHILDTADLLHVILDHWQMLFVPVTPLVLSGGT